MTQFEVEWAGMVGSARPVVLARVLEPLDFRVDDGATLDGCRLRPGVNMPRALAPDGRQREDLCSFELLSAADLPRFTVGKVVALADAGRYRDPAP